MIQVVPLPIIAEAQSRFGQLLTRATGGGPLSRQQYHRFLSMQYHLTRGVQRYFMSAAAHPDLAGRKPLRKFLFDFANEEEQHYLVAAADLAEMGLEPLGQAIDIALWHAFFESVVRDRPFIRLGAACILENISGGKARSAIQAALTAEFF